jgi:hypothetical protein
MLHYLLRKNSLLLFATFCLFINTSGQDKSKNNDSSEVITYQYPRVCPKSSTFRLLANGKEVFVHNTSVGSFAAFDCRGKVTIEIQASIGSNNIRIAPARHRVVAVRTSNGINFELNGPANLLVEIEGLEQLYIYANAPETNQPDPLAPGVKYFKAGQVYEVGELSLSSNDWLYIEGGAIVRGCIKAELAENIKISGHGVLDGSYYKQSIDGHRSILFDRCRNSSISDIIMIEPSGWMILLGASRYITVNNVKELGKTAGTDGVDICGSQHIKVHNCFFRNGDDGVVIKSINYNWRHNTQDKELVLDVEDIEVKGCALQSFLGGCPFEIGHELRCSNIKNIRFIDCDILGIHGFGAPFGIHNADRASISDVLYDNIRVEHHYDKLIDFRIIESRWGKDSIRGQARNIIFKNIDVTISVYNPGYSCSLIGGFDAKHTIENVTFENFKLNGQRVTNPDQMTLFTKQAKNITFK